MNTRLIPILLFIIALTLSCAEKAINRLTIEYTEPYFAINLSADTPIHKEPDENSDVIYRLERYRMVEMDASVSHKDSHLIWYRIKESSFQGYSQEDNFKLFESQKEAEEFLMDRYPGKRLLASVSVYELAEKDFLEGHYKESAHKLQQFLEMDPGIKENYPSLYYSAQILIGQLYLKENQTEKAIYQFNNILDESTKEAILLPGALFQPENISFYQDDIQQYIKKQPFKSRSTLLKWEIDSLQARAYEQKKETQKAKEIYQNLILSQGETSEHSNSSYKIPYINHGLNRLVAINSGDDRTEFLEYLKEKLDWKGSYRYIEYMLGSEWEIRAGNPSEKNPDLCINKAKHYYQSFVKLFESKYQTQPYPGEMKHYLNAREKLKKLSSQTPSANEPPVAVDSLNEKG